jgi:hypothetical protein
MSRGAKYDPLEAAKIGVEDDTPRVAPYVPPSQRAVALAAAMAAAAVEVDVDVEEPEAPPPAVSATPLVPIVPPRPRYRVVEAKRISVSGQIVKMLTGRILDSAGYGGEAGIQRLVDQGLKLEPV